MSDNLKIIETNIDDAIDPNAGIGGIKAIEHNAVLKDVLRKAGKYSGFFFTAKGVLDGIAGLGSLLWNGNSPDDTNDFTIRVSKLTADGNDIGIVLSRLASGGIIHFKDVTGKSFFLEFQSYSSGTDPNTNDIYDVIVKGVATNSNYIYQVAEQEVCSISFYNKISSKKERVVATASQTVINLVDRPSSIDVYADSVYQIEGEDYAYDETTGDITMTYNLDEDTIINIRKF